MTRRNMFTGLPAGEWFTAKEIRDRKATRTEHRAAIRNLYRQTHGLVSQLAH